MRTVDACVGVTDIPAAVAAGIEAGNARLSRVEQIKRHSILDGVWIPGGDELTPTLKLRRQAMRQPRKPLVLMQPKSLLRMPEAASKLEDLTNGTFRPVIDDPMRQRNRDAVRVLISAG